MTKIEEVARAPVENLSAQTEIQNEFAVKRERSTQMNQVEKVARSICLYVGKNPDDLDNNVADGLFYPNWTEFSGMARAAIGAMREPSETMVTAGYGTYDYVQRHYCRVIWRLMADAALKETP